MTDTTPGQSSKTTPPARRRRATAWRLAAVLLILGALVSLPYIGDHLRAAAILGRAAQQTGWYTRLYDAPITFVDVTIAGTQRSIAARVYRPANRTTAPGVVLLHGVQYMGIDDARLDALATELARGGFAVLTPEITSLADYRMAPEAVTDVEDSIVYLSSRSYVRSGRVAIVGASFAGGVALVAAVDPRVHARVATIIAVGAHHRVEDVARYLVEPARPGVEHESHTYGLQVFVFAHAEQFVASERVPAVRDAIRTFLHGDLRQAEQLRVALPEPEQSFVGAVFRGDRDVLGPALYHALPALRAQMDALSPAGRLSTLRDVPIILLHGRADAVIPATEAIANARELAPGDNAVLVITDALDHVHLGGGGAREQWRVVHAFAQALGTLR